MVLLGWDPAKGRRLPNLHLILNVFTKICMPPRGYLPNPRPMGAVDSRVIRSVGAGRAAAARVLPGLPEPAPATILLGEAASSLCSLWSCSWRRSSLHRASVLPRLASLAMLGVVAPWLRLPVHSHRGTKSVPLFLYTDRSPRAWATHKRDTLLGQAQNGAQAGGVVFTLVKFSVRCASHDPRERRGVEGRA